MDTSTLLPGDLVLVRGKSFIDRAIEDISHSTYSHVALVKQGTTLLEAQGGRRIGPQSLFFYKGNADIYRIKGLDEFQRNAIIAKAKTYVGERYDYSLIVWEFIRYTFGVYLPFVEEGKLICSTFVTDSIRGAGLEFCEGIKFPSPGDVAKDPSLEFIGTY